MPPPGSAKVLLIDDDEDLRFVAKRVLSKAGYRVEDLPSAYDVDARIEAFQPDVILCDVLMPGESGLSLCRRLRARAATCDVPIVLVSAKRGGGDRRAAIDAGADRYLVKPVPRDLLLQTVADVLQTGLRIEVFGCRGSLPRVPDPGEAVSRFGGHTTCVQVHVGRRPEVIVLDAGTGLRRLGRGLRRDAPIDAHLFLSHYHIDHIYGLPFFKPLYGAAHRVTIYGGVDFPRGDGDPMTWAERKLESTIGGAFNNTYWPVSMEDVPATVVYRPFYDDSNTVIEVAGIKIEVLKVNHGEVTYAYKLTDPTASAPATVVYVPDNNISPDRLPPDRVGPFEERLNAFVQGADLLIHDCMYPQAKYELHDDWGHTGATTLATFCAWAQVPEVMLFHHDVDATDEDIEAVRTEFESESAKLGSGTRARLAIEGEIVRVGGASGP